MPTDFEPVSVRKRAAQAQAQPEITMLLFWLIICLGMVGLLFEVVGRINFDGREVAKNTAKHFVKMGQGPAMGPRLPDYSTTRPISA